MRTLLAGTALVVVLAGCAGAGQTPTPAAATPTSAPSKAPTAPAATPAVTANSTPVTYGPVTIVSGVDDCGGLNPVWTIDADDAAHARGQTIECTDTTDDPRVRGTHTATWSMDIWGDVRTFTGTAGVQWGTVRLENDGGTWEGRFTGVASLPQPGDIIAISYEGTGDYDGLAYFELITGVCCVYEIYGQIFPGTYPTP